jgi:hypothetical protein
VESQFGKSETGISSGDRKLFSFLTMVGRTDTRGLKNSRSHTHAHAHHLPRHAGTRGEYSHKMDEDDVARTSSYTKAVELEVEEAMEQDKADHDAEPSSSSAAHGQPAVAVVDVPNDQGDDDISPACHLRGPVLTYENIKFEVKSSNSRSFLRRTTMAFITCCALCCVPMAPPCTPQNGTLVQCDTARLAWGG